MEAKASLAEDEVGPWHARAWHVLPRGTVPMAYPTRVHGAVCPPPSHARCVVVQVLRLHQALASVEQEVARLEAEPPEQSQRMAAPTATLGSRSPPPSTDKQLADMAAKLTAADQALRSKDKQLAEAEEKLITASKVAAVKAGEIERATAKRSMADAEAHAVQEELALVRKECDRLKAALVEAEDLQVECQWWAGGMPAECEGGPGTHVGREGCQLNKY